MNLAVTMLVLLLTQLPANGQNADSASNNRRYLFVLSRLRMAGTLVKSQAADGTPSAGLQNASAQIDSGISTIYKTVGRGSLSHPKPLSPSGSTGVNKQQKDESAVSLLNDASKNLNAVNDAGGGARSTCLAYINNAIAALQNEIRMSQANANGKAN